MNPLSSSQLTFVFLIDCSVKASAVLASAWIIASATGQRSAAFRHLVWSVGILGSLALPLLTLVLPSWHPVTIRAASGPWSTAHTLPKDSITQAVHSMVVDATVSSSVLNEIGTFIVIIWAVGLLCVVIRLVGGLGQLAWLSAHAKPVLNDDWTRAVTEICRALNIGRPLRVLQFDHSVVMPLTWGALKPVVIVPGVAAEWSEKRRRIVICHELAHIARGDWLLQVCAELAKAFYWFHPLAWIAAARLRQESEQASDDYVLNSGIEAGEYASQLLAIARTLKVSKHNLSAALALARPSHLERRFAAMLNPTLNRQVLSRQAKLLTATVAFLSLLPLAALRVPAQDLSGPFTGSICDPSGAHIPNATIIMTNQKTNSTEMTTSGSDGNFEFKALPAGEYQMEVVKRGFAEYKAPHVVLVAGREASQVVTLNVGGVTEEVDVVAVGTAKAVPEEAGRKPTRVRIGGDVQAPKIITKVQPVYPEAAKAAGTEGTVLLHAVIGMNGNPLSLRVMNSEVDPELARAAVEAVSQWRYRPTLLNGEPIEVDTTITVNFKLVP